MSASTPPVYHHPRHIWPAVLAPALAAAGAIAVTLHAAYARRRASTDHTEQIMDRIDRVVAPAVAIATAPHGQLSMDRAVLQRVLSIEAERTELSPSEYWAVYKDVMADLADVGSEPDDRPYI